MPIVSLPLTYQIANGQTADASQVMANFNQIANNVNANGAQLNTAVTFTAITANGALTFTGALANNLSAGTFKITNLGAPTAAGDALSWGAAANTANLTTTGNVVMNAPASGATLTLTGVAGATSTQNIVSGETAASGNLALRVGNSAATPYAIGLLVQAAASNYNSAVSANDAALVAQGTGVGTGALTLTAWGNTAVGVRISAPAATVGLYGTANYFSDGSTTTGYEIGFRGLPVNTQNASYTTVYADRGKVILGAGAGRTYTVPANTYQAGDVVSFANNDVSNICTIAAAAGLTIFFNGVGSTSRVLKIASTATLFFLNANNAVISGNLT